MKLPKVVVLCVIAVSAFQPRITKAQITYLDNTSQPITSTAGFNLTPHPAAQFLTGTNADGYIMNSVQFLFADASGSPDFPSYLRCGLFASDHDLPSFQLDAFVATDNPTTAGLYTFVRQNPSFYPVILDANSDYWLMFFSLGGSSAGEYRYSLTDSVNSVANDGWSMTGNAWNGQVGLPMFTINATAIPEPLSVSLCFSMVLVIACHKRFRR